MPPRKVRPTGQALPAGCPGCVSPSDPRDTYFVRILAHAPDPMLLPAVEPATDPPGYAASPLDPEWIRVVAPGRADDFAGLSVMQPLVRSKDSDRHYLVPLRR